MYANSSRRDDYLPARRTLAVFAVITILLLIVTIVVACWCTNNFNKGLKPHVQRGSSNAASSAAYGQQGVSSAGGSSHGGKAQYYMDNIGGQTPYYGQPNRPVAGSRMERLIKVVECSLGSSRVLEPFCFLTHSHERVYQDKGVSRSEFVLGAKHHTQNDVLSSCTAVRTSVFISSGPFLF